MKKTRKLIIYQDRRDNSIKLCPTYINIKGNFAQIPSNKGGGKALPTKITNAALGKAVMEILKQCK